MSSRCMLGWDAGSLLDRPGGPVLPEYTYNVIRKYNSKTDLMCLIDRRCVLSDWFFGVAFERYTSGFIGLYGELNAIAERSPQRRLK